MNAKHEYILLSQALSCIRLPEENTAVASCMFLRIVKALSIIQFTNEQTSVAVKIFFTRENFDIQKSIVATLLVFLTIVNDLIFKE